MNKIDTFAQIAYDHLCADSEVGQFVDPSLPLPAAFGGKGDVRLIILGQDPTVKNAAARKSITTVLNLNKSGNLRTYLLKVCGLLGMNLDTEVYATNLYKNFFIQEPTQIKEVDIFSRCLRYWLPVLQQELDAYPGVPVLTLGEPLLSAIVCPGVSGKVRDYWGYTHEWKRGVEQSFSYLASHRTILERVIFPFPHQPSWQRKKFYSDRLERYCSFVNEIYVHPR